MFPTILHQVRTTLFREVPKPLGRWSIDKCDTSVSVVNYYANVDHCGSCDYQKEMIDSMIQVKSKDKETKETN